MSILSDKDADQDVDDDRDEATSAAGSAPEEASTSTAAEGGEKLARGTTGAHDDDDVSDEDLDFGEDVLAMSGMLGPERWVQFSFIAIGFLIFFLSDKLADTIMRRFMQPDPLATAAIGAVLGLAGGFYAYRHPKSRKIAEEVVEELSQVTWPSRQETYTSTIVVVVTSVVAALYTGVFDAIWSAITDLVYHI